MPKANPLETDNSLGYESRSTSTNRILDSDPCFKANNSDSSSSKYSSSNGEDESYWKFQYERLFEDYNRLQKLNQNLEDKLLNIVEACEKNKQELVANIEHEKSTLMADVNKLSTKLVDARIKLHDFEEKELIHAAACDSPCHKNSHSRNCRASIKKDQNYDPNLV